MADAESRVILTAVDNVTATLNRIEGSVGNVTGKFENFGRALGALGIATGVTAAVSALTGMVSKSIEAADAIGEMAQRTGVSGETLSRFQLAANNSGTSIEGLGSALQKLGIKMDDAAEGGKESAEAFQRIGVSVTDASGKLKSTEEVLLEVADKFAGMENGATKTALAVAIFGKAGADMIPFLNQGAEGLAQAAEMADKLGLTLSETTIAAADQTADAMGLVSSMMTGFANKVMAAVLPTVLTLIEGFQRFVLETGALDIAAKAVAGTFNVLVNAGQLVGAIFRLVLNNVSTTAKALMLVAQGEFTQAWESVKGGFKNAGDIVVDTGKSMVQVWTRTVDDVVKGADSSSNSVGKVTAAHKEASKSSKDLDADYKQVMATLNSKAAAMIAGANATKTLTEAEKLELDILGQIRDGKLSVTAAQWEQIAAVIETIKQREKEKVATDAARKSDEDAQKQRVATIDAEWKTAEALQAAIDKQKQSNEEIGKTKTELANLEIKRLTDARAIAEQRLRTLELNSASASEIEAVRMLVENYDVLIGLKRDGATAASMADAAEAAKKAAEESQKSWQETAKTIETSLTDALMRGFESGKGFLENLVSTAKNLFQTLVLRPMIQAVVSPISAGITGMLGLSGGANAAGGAGGALGGLGNIGSMLGGIGGSLGAFGSSFGASISTMFSGPGLMATLGEAGALMSSGGIAAGLGMGLGAIAPYALAAFAVYSLLKGKAGGPKSGGQSILDFAGGEVSTSSLQSMLAGDGGRILFTPSGEDSKAFGLSSSALASIRATAAALGGSAGDLTLGLGFDRDPKGTAGSRYSSILRRGSSMVYSNLDVDVGRDDGALESALSEEVARLTLAGLQGSSLPQVFADYFSSFNVAEMSAEQVTAALEAAQAAKSMADSVQNLGGVFQSFSGLTVEARGNILALTGGLEGFNQKVGSFVTNYFSQEEQTGIAAAGILQQLGAVGIDAGDLSSKYDFRRLVDSLDLSSSSGQAKFAALMNVQGAFSGLADKLQPGFGLADLAAEAPMGAAYEVLVGSADAASETATSTRETADGISALVRQNAEAYTRMIELLEEIATNAREQASNAALLGSAPVDMVQPG